MGLYFLPSINAGIQKKNVPHDSIILCRTSCYLYAALLVKNPAFLGEKFSVGGEGNRDCRVASLRAMTEG